MRHVVLFERLSFQRHKLDDAGNPTIEADGPEDIVYKGHDVPDYVPDWERAALANSGMIVAVAEFPQPAPVPQDLGPVAPKPAEPTGPVAPKPTDSRADWESYATSDAVGMTDDEAASYPNKQALIDAVNAKTAQP
jgi:hypothetical protein